jgi:hypothetical protein
MLWNPKFHYGVHKSSPPIPIQSHATWSRLDLNLTVRSKRTEYNRICITNSVELSTTREATSCAAIR